MMDCAEARRLLLEGDLPALTAGGDTDLGRHLATCARCRSAAEGIRAAEGALAEWLRARSPGGDAAGAVARAGAEALRRSHARRSLGAAGAIAAAAAVVLLLLPRTRLPAPGAPAPRAPASARGFSVTAPPGRDVMVLHTGDPRIIVVWFPTIRRTS